MTNKGTAATVEHQPQQFYIQRGTKKWRTLEEYSLVFEVDFEQLIREKIARKGGNVVFADIGMGMGVALNEAVREFSPNLIGVGVDPVDWREGADSSKRAEEAIKELKKTLGIKQVNDILNKKNIIFIKKDAQSVDFPEGERPDIITAYAVLQYDKDPIKAYEHLFNQLNNGGALMVHFVFPRDERTLEAYLNMLDYLRRKAQIKWRYECDLLRNDVNLYIIAKKGNENIAINAKRKGEVKDELIKGKKNVQYSYKPSLVRDNDILGFYLDKFLMIAVEKVLKSPRLSSMKRLLRYYKYQDKIIVDYKGESISEEELKVRIPETVRKLFRESNLEPPKVNIGITSQTTDGDNYIVLDVTALAKKDRVMTKEAVVNQLIQITDKKSSSPMGYLMTSSGGRIDIRWSVDPRLPEAIKMDFFSNGQSIGYVRFYSERGLSISTQLNYVYIEPQFRNSGYTAVMISAALKWLRHQSVTAVGAYIQNPLLFKILQDNGFVERPRSSIPGHSDSRQEVIILKDKKTNKVLIYALSDRGRKSLRKFIADPNNPDWKIFEVVDHPIDGEKCIIGGIYNWKNYEAADVQYNKVISQIKFPTSSDKALKGDDSAMAVIKHVKGGIDLTPANMNIQVKTGSPTNTFGDDSGGIKFHLDPAMLAQLQNASGFVPVIINVQPLNDLKSFLGIVNQT